MAARLTQESALRRGRTASAMRTGPRRMPPRRSSAIASAAGRERRAQGFRIPCIDGPVLRMQPFLPTRKHDCVLSCFCYILLCRPEHF